MLGILAGGKRLYFAQSNDAARTCDQAAQDVKRETRDHGLNLLIKGEQTEAKLHPQVRDTRAGKKKTTELDQVHPAGMLQTRPCCVSGPLDARQELGSSVLGTRLSLVFERCCRGGQHAPRR